MESRVKAAQRFNICKAWVGGFLDVLSVEGLHIQFPFVPSSRSSFRTSAYSWSQAMPQSITDAPAMLQWSPEAGPRYLGLGHPVQQCFLSADFGFDASQHDATVRLCVPIRLKDFAKKMPIYVLVHPHKIREATPQDDEIPSVVTSAFIAGAEQCSSSQHILALKISLQGPCGLQIVGPSNMKSLAPARQNHGCILDALRSLSCTTEFIVYLQTSPETRQDLVERIRAFCDDVASGILKPGGSEYALKMMYRGAGGQDVSSLLQDYHHAPPAYGDVTPCRHSPVGPSIKRLLNPGPLSVSSGDSPRSKKPAVHDDLTAETVESWMRRLVQVELETSLVKGRLAANDVADTPTENASVADHFERLDDRVRELQTHMDALQQTVALQRDQIEKQQQQIEQQKAELEKLRDDTETHTECVRNQVDDVLYLNGYQNVHETIQDIIDDELTKFKSEQEDWLHEEVREELPRLLRTALRTMLPRCLAAATQLRVDFEPGWRWSEMVDEDDDDED